MDGCDGSGMGFSHDGGHSVINPMSGEVSDMAMSSMPLHTKPSNASDPFFSSGWDPISSLSQNQTYMISNRHIPSYPYPPPIWENQGINSNCTPQLPHYQPESSFVGLPSFVSRGFPEMAGSLGLPECSQIANSGCPPNYGEGTQARAPHSQECRNSEEDATGSPSNERRRKRSPESGDPNKKNEGELGKDPPGDATEVPKEQNEKKQRIEQTESANSQGKQSSKQAKEDSNSGDAPKENYIHVRARRGQATNSHSLAERVRREKISERMRLLQELVPGCNKITGKAVMLDEIINYVQSLQQQVEFLSMKLATLIPDLGIDLERALSKEVLQSHSRDAIVRGLGPGTGSSLPFAPGLFQNSLPGVSSTSQYNPLPQAPLDNDLQTLFQMGFDSSSAMDILKNNARLKSEQ